MRGAGRDAHPVQGGADVGSPKRAGVGGATATTAHPSRVRAEGGPSRLSTRVQRGGPSRPVGGGGGFPRGPKAAKRRKREPPAAGSVLVSRRRTPWPGWLPTLPLEPPRQLGEQAGVDQRPKRGVTAEEGEPLVQVVERLVPQLAGRLTADGHEPLNEVGLIALGELGDDVLNRLLGNDIVLRPEGDQDKRNGPDELDRRLAALPHFEGELTNGVGRCHCRMNTRPPAALQPWKLLPVGRPPSPGRAARLWQLPTAPRSDGEPR